MSPEIYAAWIVGAATVLAALIGVIGVVAIVTHRAMMLQLCKEVEAYHRHEGAFIRKLLEAADVESPLSDKSLSAQRGIYRTQEFGDDYRPKMTAHQARQIRRELLDFS